MEEKNKNEQTTEDVTRIYAHSILSKKKILIIIAIIIILIMLIYLIFQKNNTKTPIPIEIESKKEETIEKDFNYRVFDNTGEYIKGKITIQKAGGIEQIEYPKEHGEGTVILDCYGKEMVSIDYETEFEGEYNFKITTASGTENKILKVDDNFLDEYIKIEQLNDIHYNTVTIKYNNIDTVTKYYKLEGIDNDWKEYTDYGIILDYPENDLEKVNVLGKEVDTLGNTIIHSKTIPLNAKVARKKINVFDDYENYEKDYKNSNNSIEEEEILKEYGFSYGEFYRVETYKFEKRNFYLAHSSENYNYGGTFTLDWSRFNNLITKEVTAKYYWTHNGRYQGGPWFSVQIVYKDGTKNTSEDAIYDEKEGYYIATVPAKSNDIQSVNFILKMKDVYSGSSSGTLKEIEINVMN